MAVEDSQPAVKKLAGRPDQPDPPTGAARYNREMLRRIKATLRTDPEAEIVSLLPSSYSRTLKAAKGTPGAAKKRDSLAVSVASRDLRSSFRPTDVATVIYLPSDDLNLPLEGSGPTSIAAIPIPESALLGGVGGEGCQDGRRFERMHPGPINSIQQFEDFILSGAKVPGLYKGVLRKLLPTSSMIVCTHGDIRPANIMVEQRDGQWAVSGIIDWETAGIYPDYWEAIKMTNNLWPGETSDWYDHLPKSVSQHRYRVPWLVDRVLGRYMEHR